MMLNTFQHPFRSTARSKVPVKTKILIVLVILNGVLTHHGSVRANFHIEPVIFKTRLRCLSLKLPIASSVIRNWVIGGVASRLCYGTSENASIKDWKGCLKWDTGKYRIRRRPKMRGLYFVLEFDLDPFSIEHPSCSRGHVKYPIISVIPTSTMLAGFFCDTEMSFVIRGSWGVARVHVAVLCNVWYVGQEKYEISYYKDARWWPSTSPEPKLKDCCSADSKLGFRARLRGANWIEWSRVLGQRAGCAEWR